MSLFKKILIGIAALVLVFVVVVAMQPADFKVERSAVVAAPPEMTRQQVDDFRNWKDWSPWAKMDPDTKIELSDNPVGEGATYAWESEKTGAGTMTITETADTHTAIDLRFTKPFKAENTVIFAFKPIHGGTQITWLMTGKNNFVGKAMSLFFDMDEMVGGDFEKGLADIKRNAEIASGWREE